PRKASHAHVDLGGGIGLKLNTGKLEREAKNKISGLIWGAAIGLFILVCIAGVFVFVLWKVKQASDETASGASGGGAEKVVKWDGKSPYTCGAADHVRIENVTANIPSGTAITAMAACQLTLVNVNITAPVALEASATSKVTVKGGSLKG